MKNKTQVVLLPTDTKEQITFVKHTQGKNVGKLQIPFAGGEYRRLLSYGFEPQHLYFLSDEEIKEGDWFYADEFAKPEQAKVFDSHLVNGFIKSACKKIIATTDESLKQELFGLGETALCSLPQPSQQFIEHYVNEYNAGRIIEWVNVEYREHPFSHPDKNISKGDIGLLVNSDNTINITSIKDSFTKEDLISFSNFTNWNYTYSLLDGIPNYCRFGKRFTAEEVFNQWISENL